MSMRLLMLVAALFAAAVASSAPTPSPATAPPSVAPCRRQRWRPCLPAVRPLSGQTLMASNSADERRDPASLTKLMTAYLVFGALRAEDDLPSQMVNVSQRCVARRRLADVHRAAQERVASTSCCAG